MCVDMGILSRLLINLKVSLASNDAYSDDIGAFHFSDSRESMACDIDPSPASFIITRS